MSICMISVGIAALTNYVRVCCGLKLQILSVGANMFTYESNHLYRTILIPVVYICGWGVGHSGT